MATRTPLPSDGALLLTDGGLETVLIFHQGVDLPAFAAFPLLDDPAGTERLRDYFREYLGLAAEGGAGFVLETPTWRASARWGPELGYGPADLDRVNRAAVALMEELRAEWRDRVSPILISGCVGPHGDGYAPEEILSADEAQAYHGAQIATFADTAADLVTAMTITYADEAIGIARAARDAGVPVVISFTLETDGALPSGQSLGDAIRAVDEATDAYAVHYMINCAHPTHFAATVEDAGDWTERVGGLRANASTRSHAELDEAEDLDDGDPEDLGRRYAAVRPRLDRLRVVGGCCGTDTRHVAAIRRALLGT